MYTRDEDFWIGMRFENEDKLSVKDNRNWFWYQYQAFAVSSYNFHESFMRRNNKKNIFSGNPSQATATFHDTSCNKKSPNPELTHSCSKNPSLIDQRCSCSHMQSQLWVGEAIYPIIVSFEFRVDLFLDRLSSEAI